MDVSFSMIIVDMVILKQRAKYAAALQISLALGLVSGALVGALVIQEVSWRWCVLLTYYFTWSRMLQDSLTIFVGSFGPICL